MMIARAHDVFIQNRIKIDRKDHSRDYFLTIMSMSMKGSILQQDQSTSFMQPAFQTEGWRLKQRGLAAASATI